MKKVVLISAILLLWGMGMLTLAQADSPYPGTLNLYDRGGGMIYDSDLNITWLKDAGMGGMKNWYDAMIWADNLNYGGYDNWRLPTTSEIIDVGYVNVGEMGHLFYTELGNSGGTLTNSGPFTNLGTNGYGSIYWTSTTYSSNPDFAWLFYFDLNELPGRTDTDVKVRQFGAWAVRDGDVASVPEPATMLLLGLGLLGLAATRRMVQK
jgi:hypothetical protein